ncbi:helix-turn-helix transcriptional regulator [Cytobacillus massiliigabonensis]|uniref:helix-turn-helix transcriptional regulator n=1 Tax=Cytobacillus massiliigabonensis TaxID=1871011 RepID=UPI001157C459|nr:helix-turn-helix transcriptional regulator [Cytobacillus massiliigabonensis]
MLKISYLLRNSKKSYIIYITSNFGGGLTFKVGRCRIQDLLDARGMTQQDLANKTGYSKQYINDKIRSRGKNGMWVATAKTIAEGIGCTVEELYEWERVEEDSSYDKERGNG